MDEKAQVFLKELAQLSKKHGLYIGGCGCCDAPYVYDKDYNDLAKHLTWVPDKQEYIEN